MPLNAPTPPTQPAPAPLASAQNLSNQHTGSARGNAAKTAQAAARAQDIAPVIEEMKAAGAATLRALAAGLNERGVPAARVLARA